MLAWCCACDRLVMLPRRHLPRRGFGIADDGAYWYTKPGFTTGRVEGFA